MFILDPGARLHFIQPPPVIRKAFKRIDSNKQTVMDQCRFKDRRNSWVGNQRFRAPDGLSIVVVFAVDQNAARPQQPRLDTDLKAHALDSASEWFLCRFGIIDRLPKLFGALATSHKASLR